MIKRIPIPSFGQARERDAARVLAQNGAVLAVIAEPATRPESAVFRDAVIDTVLREDFGDLMLAGVAFAAEWGGDAIGFT